MKEDDLIRPTCPVPALSGLKIMGLRDGPVAYVLDIKPEAVAAYRGGWRTMTLEQELTATFLLDLWIEITRSWLDRMVARGDNDTDAEGYSFLCSHLLAAEACMQAQQIRNEDRADDDMVTEAWRRWRERVPADERGAAEIDLIADIALAEGVNVH